MTSGKIIGEAEAGALAFCFEAMGVQRLRGSQSGREPEKSAMAKSRFPTHRSGLYIRRIRTTSWPSRAKYNKNIICKIKEIVLLFFPRMFNMQKLGRRIVSVFSSLMSSDPVPETIPMSYPIFFDPCGLSYNPHHLVSILLHVIAQAGSTLPDLFVTKIHLVKARADLDHELIYLCYIGDSVRTRMPNSHSH